MPDLEPLPFIEAIEFWADKITLSPKEFYEISDEARALAFSVAGIAKIAELDSVKSIIDKSLAEGLTFKEFQAQAGDLFSKRGWSGKNHYRVDNIFRTNIQTAYNAGQYNTLKRNTDILPYWTYSAVGDGRTRPEHAAMSGRTWPADHEVWDTWFPPNGFRCRCSVYGSTQKQAQGRSVKVETSNPTGDPIPVYNSKGEKTGTVPLQPDPGFSANPGKAWAGNA